MEDYLNLHSTPSSSSLSDYDVLSRVSGDDDELIGSAAEYEPISITEADSVVTSRRDSWGSSDASLSVLSSFASEGGTNGDNDAAEQRNSNHRHHHHHSSHEAGLYRATGSASSSALIDWRDGAAAGGSTSIGADDSNELDRSFDLNRDFALNAAAVAEYRGLKHEEQQQASTESSCDDLGPDIGIGHPRMVQLKDVPSYLRWMVLLRYNYMKNSISVFKDFSSRTRAKNGADSNFYSKVSSHSNWHLPLELNLNKGPNLHAPLRIPAKFSLLRTKTSDSSTTFTEIYALEKLKSVLELAGVPLVQVYDIDITEDGYSLRLCQQRGEAPEKTVQYKRTDKLKTVVGEFCLAALVVDIPRSVDWSPISQFYQYNDVHLLTIAGNLINLDWRDYNLPIDLSLPYKTPKFSADSEWFKWPKRISPLTVMDLTMMPVAKTTKQLAPALLFPEPSPYSANSVTIVGTGSASKLSLNTGHSLFGRYFVELFVPRDITYADFWNNTKFKYLPLFACKILGTLLTVALFFTSAYLFLFSNSLANVSLTSQVSLKSGQNGAITGLQGSLLDQNFVAHSVKSSEVAGPLATFTGLTLDSGQGSKPPTEYHEVSAMSTMSSLSTLSVVQSKEIAVSNPLKKDLSVIQQQRKDVIEYAANSTKRYCRSFLWKMQRGAVTLCKKNAMLNVLYNGALSLEMPIKNVVKDVSCKAVTVRNSFVGDLYDDATDYSKSKLSDAYELSIAGAESAQRSIKSLSRTIQNEYLPKTTEGLEQLSDLLAAKSAVWGSKTKDYSETLWRHTQAAANSISTRWRIARSNAPTKAEVQDSLKLYASAAWSQSKNVSNIVSEKSKVYSRSAADAVVHATKTTYYHCRMDEGLIWLRSNLKFKDAGIMSLQLAEQTSENVKRFAGVASKLTSDLSSRLGVTAWQTARNAKVFGAGYINSFTERSAESLKSVRELKRQHGPLVYTKVSDVTQRAGRDMQDWFNANKGPIKSMSQEAVKTATNWLNGLLEVDKEGENKKKKKQKMQKVFCLKSLWGQRCTEKKGRCLNSLWGGECYEVK